MTNILLILTCGFIFMGVGSEYKRITNLRVKGWLFGDKGKWVVNHTPASTTAIDSFYLSGVDTSDYVIASYENDSTYTAPLTIRCWKQDSLVARYPDTLTHDKEYINIIIIKD